MVEIREVPELRGFSVIKKIPNRNAISSELRQNAVLIFHGRDGNEMIVEIFTPDPNGDKVLPPAKLAVAKFVGTADKVDNAYAKILFWALREGKNLGMPTREVYLKVDTRQTPPEVEVEVQTPIQ